MPNSNVGLLFKFRNVSYLLGHPVQTKAFAGTRGMIFKKMFSDFIYFNVKLIVLPKILYL